MSAPRMSDEHLRQIRAIEADAGKGPSLLHGEEVVAIIDDLHDARVSIARLKSALIAESDRAFAIGDMLRLQGGD